MAAAGLDPVKLSVMVSEFMLHLARSPAFVQAVAAQQVMPAQHHWIRIRLQKTGASPRAAADGAVTSRTDCTASS